MFGIFKNSKLRVQSVGPSSELRAFADHFIREAQFKLLSGRAVQIEQIHIQLSEPGWLEGDPDRVRATVNAHDRS